MYVVYSGEQSGRTEGEELKADVPGGENCPAEHPPSWYLRSGVNVGLGDKRTQTQQPSAPSHAATEHKLSFWIQGLEFYGLRYTKKYMFRTEILYLLFALVFSELVTAPAQFCS